MRILVYTVSMTLILGCRSPSGTFRAKISSTPHHQQTLILPIAPSPSGPSPSSPSPSSPSPSSPSPSAAQAFSIDGLVHLGHAKSPRLKEAKHRIASIQARIPQALSLPDPIINTTTHLSPVETAAGQQAFALGISQKWTNTDRRATRAAIVHEELSVARADLLRVEQELAEQIRVACFQLLAVRETIRITGEDIESLEQIEEVVLRQYEVKKNVSQQDVLNIQIELSNIENELTKLRQKEQILSARLARLVRMPIGSSFELTDRLSDVAHDVDVEAMVAQALHSRPELSLQLAEIRRERRKICLANLQGKPDFTVGLNWIATSSEGISPVANGDDALLLGIGFNLPIRTSRITAARREAQQSSLASVAKFESLQDQIAEEIFDSYIKLDSTALTLSLLRNDILPKSLRNLDLSIEEYAEGKSSYTQLIENWRSLLKYRVVVANLQSQRMQLMAQLTRQLGQLAPTPSMVAPKDPQES